MLGCHDKLKPMNAEAPNQKTLQKNLWSNFLFAFLGIAVALVTSIALFPRWREKVKAYVQKPYREVLAKAYGDLSGQGDFVNVIKVKTEEGLLIEVFEAKKQADGEKLLARLPLDEKRDAFMSFSGDATNLGLIDFDGDGTLEIMAPAYDENFVPRLSVFKFDPVSKSFIKQGPDSKTAPNPEPSPAN